MKEERRILLSICLPTKNQPAKFDRLLKSIVPQLSSEIELIVCDDSDDKLSRLIFEKYMPPTKENYFQGPRGGLDRAILFLTQKARGEYIWWIGDDVVEMGLCQKIVNLIRNNNEIDFIYINSKEIPTNTIAFNLGRDHFFASKNQVIEEIRGSLGFISATILKREKAITDIKGAEKFIGTAWANLYLVLHVLSQGNKFYYISSPYIMGDPKLPDKPSWYDGFQTFAVNLFYVFKEFENDFSKQSIDKVLRANFNNIWRGILVHRAKGYNSGLGSKTPKVPVLLKIYYNLPEFWLVLPLLLLPRKITARLYRIYKLLSRKQNCSRSV